MGLKKFCLFWAAAFLSAVLCRAALCFADEKTDQQSEYDEIYDGLYSKAAVLIDADGGRVLFSKNADELMPMASTTKIMTAVIALENAAPDLVCTASSYAASMPKVHMGVYEGQQFYLEDLLLGMMLESYNDAAVIIAENVAGSVENFAKLMNDKAKEIGAVHTHFVTPNGLDADGHQTTAKDMALIMAYCIKNEDFLKITQTRSHYFSDINGTRTYSAVNHNSFLDSYDGLLSGKTGYTSAAGYCYVGAASDEDRTFAAAFLACGWPPDKTLKWKDAKRLFDYGFKYYNKEIIDLSGLSFPNAVVKDGKRGSVKLRISSENIYECLISPLDKKDISYEINRFLLAPVQINERVGSVRLSINGEIFFAADILTAQLDERVDLLFMFRRALTFLKV